MTTDTMNIPADDVIAEITSMPTVERLVQLCADIQSRPRRVTWVEVPFGDGVYRFHLNRRQIDELERACGYTGRDGQHVPLGVAAIFARVAKGRAFLPTGSIDWNNITEAEILASEITQRDCIETIRLGLIGGNRGVVDGAEITVSPARAMQLLEAYVVGQPIEDAWHYAFATLGALIYGIEAPMMSDETV
jgi:hypothetical protein